MRKKEDHLLKIAYYLSIITIVYNLLEGGISTYLGAEEDTLALFGFGVDSFVEVISGIGIFHMVSRMRKEDVSTYDKFERQALRITGFSFYLLTTGIAVGVVISMTSENTPETTLPNIIISSISILTMYFLMKYKFKVGNELGSEPIIADANCTKTCFYLSFILLASGLLYHFFSIRFVDEIGSLGIAWFAFKEGKEAFEKAQSNKVGCVGDCH